MTAYLLDVNVLLALSWPGHASHESVQKWFAAHARKGWATCPMVEAGFVRVLSNPAFSARAVLPGEALEALKFNTKHSGHQFWPDDISLADALKSLKYRVVGHQQITDAYLVALAIHRKGRLATLDKGIGAWASAEVEVIE
jgi:toxin-antitoxin system PIN domain toxin